MSVTGGFKPGGDCRAGVARAITVGSNRWQQLRHFSHGLFCGCYLSLLLLELTTTFLQLEMEPRALQLTDVVVLSFYGC